MTNYTIDTEFTEPQKCCKCNEIIDEGLIKTNRSKEFFYCPEHGIVEIRQEMQILRHKAIKLAGMINLADTSLIEEKQCVECKNFYEGDRDIELCDKCIDKFDLDSLWELHDLNALCALDFNESEEIRERFRKGKPE